MFDSTDNPTLSVPYTGFKGDWSQPQFLDNMPDFSDKVNYKPIEYPNGGIDKTGFMRRQKKRWLELLERLECRWQTNCIR